MFGRVGFEFFIASTNLQDCAIVLDCFALVLAVHPEKPLSDMGHRTYVSYWTNRVLNFLLKNVNPNLSIQDIAEATGITLKDIQYVLDSY